MLHSLAPPGGARERNIGVYSDQSRALSRGRSLTIIRARSILIGRQDRRSVEYGIDRGVIHHPTPMFQRILEAVADIDVSV